LSSSKLCGLISVRETYKIKHFFGYQEEKTYYHKIMLKKLIKNWFKPFENAPFFKNKLLNVNLYYWLHTIYTQLFNTVGGLVLGSNQFLRLPQLSQKIILTSKVVKKWRKNNHFGSMVLIRDTLCSNHSSSMTLTLFPSNLSWDSNPS